MKPFSTTGIGSLPHKDPARACELVLESVDIPFWPQLPALGFRELMIPQYIESFPFARIEGESVWATEAEEEELYRFYAALESDEGFPITPAHAAGFYAFEELLGSRPRFPALKGHITGPLTFTLGLTDREKKPVFFDEERRELALSLLKGKALWQIRQLRKYADQVLLFVDEPILSALGTSAYLGVPDEEAARLLRETMETIRSAGALSAIHCCSKAHWPLVVASGVDILNFDAYDYADSLTLYPEEVRQFVQQGGIVAWGVVPTTEAIKTTDLGEVTDRLRRALAILEGLGVEPGRIRRQSLLTPSCGAGSLSEPEAEKVFGLLKELGSRAQGL